MSSQTTSKVFMVKPVNFKYNTQTAGTNSFMNQNYKEDTQQAALKETNEYVSLLQKNLIKVVLVEDSKEPETPDSVFPNNWFTTHENGVLVLYPMCAENRRQERKQIFIDEIKKNINCKNVIDLTFWEKKNKFLEGTGSMVLDRVNKIVYACRSPRTCEEVLDDFCQKLNYKKVVFDATNEKNEMIYHTNVILCVAENFAVVCLDAVKNEQQKNEILESFKKTNKKVIKISLEQVNNYAGNMLEVKNEKNEKFLIMSDAAYKSFTKDQLNEFQKECKILHPNIECIETIGGGSARCMLAELY